MPDLVESMKKAALDAMDASKPVAIVFGYVQSSDPLQILVEQKLILTAPMLIMTRNVTDFSVDVTVDWRTTSALGKHTHPITGLTTDTAGALDPHSHTIPDGETGENEKSLSHGHSVSGRKSMTVHNSLQTGEFVLLLRMSGGQQYVVVDRMI